MAGFSDIVGIGFRIIAHRDEIIQVYDKIVPMIRSATSMYPDIKILIDKIAPGVIAGQVVETSPLAHGAVEPGGVANFSIAWLQESLNKLDNAGLDVDGEMGEQTTKAISAFQKKHGLEVDGWAGAGTSAAILMELEKQPA